MMFMRPNKVFYVTPVDTTMMATLTHKIECQRQAPSVEFVETDGKDGLDSKRPTRTGRSGTGRRSKKH
jgi:hypothetical protein